MNFKMQGDILTNSILTSIDKCYLKKNWELMTNGYYLYRDNMTQTPEDYGYISCNGQRLIIDKFDPSPHDSYKQKVNLRDCKIDDRRIVNRTQGIYKMENMSEWCHTIKSAPQIMVIDKKVIVNKATRYRLTPAIYDLLRDSNQYDQLIYLYKSDEYYYIRHTKALAFAEEKVLLPCWTKHSEWVGKYPSSINDCLFKIKN